MRPGSGNKHLGIPKPKKRTQMGSLFEHKAKESYPSIILQGETWNFDLLWENPKKCQKNKNIWKENISRENEIIELVVTNYRITELAQPVTTLFVGKKEKGKATEFSFQEISTQFKNSKNVNHNSFYNYLKKEANNKIVKQDLNWASESERERSIIFSYDGISEKNTQLLYKLE